MANINVGELIVVNTLPTQTELNNQSITVGSVTKNFNFPVVFRKVTLNASVDYTYTNAVDSPISSFNPDLTFMNYLNINGATLSGITTVLNVPDGIEVITVSAFNNRLITQLALPSTLLSIEDIAFASNKLTSITIPNSVTTIGERAFAYNQLTAVVLPTNCTYYASSFPVTTVVTGGILIT